MTDPLSARGTKTGTVGALIRDIAAFARWRLAGMAVLAIVAAAAEGAGLLMLAPLLHFVGLTGPGTASPLPAISLEQALTAYVALIAVAALVIATRDVAVSTFRSDYVDNLRRCLHDALLRMEFRAFSQLRAADTQHTLISECGQSAYGVDFLLRLAGWAVEIPVLLAVALRLSPALTAASLALAVLCLALGRPLSRRAYALGQQQTEVIRLLQGDLADDLAGMRIIRGEGLESLRRQRFGARTHGLRTLQKTYQHVSGLSRAAMQTLVAVAAAVTVWLAVRLLDMALADTLALMVAFARLLATTLRIQDGWRTVQQMLAAHASVQNLLARCRMTAEPSVERAAAEPSVERAAAEPPPEHAAAEPPSAQDLTLAQVGFGYDPARPVLHAIDAKVPARAMTALVGPSGAGKSTLADLLLGLLTPDQGGIMVGGQPLTGALRRSWRRQVGYVPQDAFLFHDTIRANLAMAAPHAGEADLWEGLRQAAAEDFVRALPQGLDTVVGDRGNRLSGGQRQRLALARALLAKPMLLILDEATSALDSGNERHILDALERLRGRLTMVVVAHRPSTVRRADHVIVMDGGRVVATGTWAEACATAKPLMERLTMEWA